MAKKTNGSISLYGNRDIGFATLSTVAGRTDILPDGWAEDRVTPKHQTATEAVWSATDLLRNAGVDGQVEIVVDLPLSGCPTLKVSHRAVAPIQHVPAFGSLRFVSSGVAL